MSKRAKGDGNVLGGNILSEATAAAALASAAALVGRIRQHPALPVAPPPEGLWPRWPLGYRG